MCLLQQTPGKGKRQIRIIRHAFSAPFIVCVYVCVPGSCQQIVCLFMTGLNHVSIKMLSHSHRTELGFFFVVSVQSFWVAVVLNY